MINGGIILHSYFRSFRGYLRIRIKGYGVTRFINICSKRGIKLWDVEKDNEEYRLCMTVPDFRKIPDIVRKTGVKAAIVSKHGLPFFFAKMSYRKCFVIGACLCFVGLLYMKNFIWAIETEGNVSITDDMILDFLEENDVEIGTKINNVDSESLEKLFRKEFPDITWVSVGQQGTALTIDIKERDVALYDEKEYLSSSLYAPHDGVIMSVVVRSGLSQVKAGDIVTAGQLVVDGVLPIIKTDGTISGYNLVNADADVILCYTESYYDEISLYTEEKIYTGNVSKEYYLRIGNQTMQFHWFKPEYEKCEFTQSFYQIKLWENFYLPLWIGYGEYKEYALNRIKPDKKALEAQLYENLDLFLESLEEKGVQNIQKDVKISTGGSMLILSGDLTFTNPNMLRKEIDASIGTELENGQYNSVDNGNER